MSGNTLDKTHPSRSSDDCSEITNGDKNIGEHHAISENTFCSICHQHFTDLFRHSKRSHPMVELECAYCELKFESKAAIRKHFKVDHRQMNRLTCDICHKSNLSKWVKMIFFFWESSFISNRLCFPFQTVLRTPSRVPQSLAGQSARLRRVRQIIPRKNPSGRSQEGRSPRRPGAVPGVRKTLPEHCAAQGPHDTAS